MAGSIRFVPELIELQYIQRWMKFCVRERQKLEQELGYEDFFKDSLRPSRLRSWQSYFLDQPPLGGEVMAMAGIHGLTFVTTDDARAMWGTPFRYPGESKLSICSAAN